MGNGIVINCIGIGHWGPNLVRALTTHPDARVGLVCDISEDRLKLIGQKIPSVGGFTTDSAAALTDPNADAVVIATPARSHFSLAKIALEAGKHVLVEKPICLTSSEATELIRIAEERQRILAVGHVFLFNNAVRGLRNIIRSGELGPVKYIYSTRTNLGPIRSDVNALWDLAAHDLSIFDYWLGAEALSVTASGKAFIKPGIEDVVFASFEYPNGIIASVHASWLNPRKVREITVVGEHKMAVLDDIDLNNPLRIYNKSVAIEREPIYSDSFGSFRTQIRNGDVLIPYLGGGEPLTAECSHFIDCVLGRASPVNDAHGGLRVLKALEAADRSLKDNSRAVSV
ncbi:MAG: Gfo/Idh/MocA family protein [Verrucomicrobiota bacterium]